MKKTHNLPGVNVKKGLLGAALLIASLSSSVFAQSNPTPQAVPYNQDFSGLAASSATYPAGWQGWDISTSPGATFNTAGPLADRALTASGDAASSAGACYNYNGKLGFLNNGSLDETLCLAINTTGASSVQVQYDIMTLRNPYNGGSNTRSNAVVLQYRVGTSGAWTSVTGTEYTNNAVAQTGSGVTTPQNSQTLSTVLPPSCDNQAVVQLRWAQRQVSGGGSRPSFAIDNVSAASGQSPPSIVTPPSSINGFSGATASFQVVASGTSPLYFWYKNSVLISDGSRISGSTTSTLVISNLAVGDSADYVVVVTNAYGSVTSAPATLSVSDSAPNFLVQPQSRSALVGVPVILKASVEGSMPLTYRWQKNGVNLADDGRIVGSGTASLTISNLVAGDAADYTLAVTNPISGVVSSPATLTVGTTGILAGWDFNGALNPTNPVSSQGSSAAIASVVGGAVGFSNNVASGLDFGSPNNAWGTSTYPTQGTGNKTAGIQVAVSTVGYKNLSLTFDQRMTATSSRYTRLQYTTNGVNYIDYPVSSDINLNNLTNNTSYQSRRFDLLGRMPGVRNNPNFGVRMVTEFEGTAKYGATTNSYVGNTGSYSPSGTVSYDLFTINAEQITDANTPPTIAALTNQTTLDTVPVTVNVTIGDTETPAGSLTVTAVSTNHTVLNDGQIAVGGSGSARTLTITPTPGLTGIVPILVTVTDAAGDSTMGWFYLTINPGNFAPTITAIPHTNTLVATPLTIPFTVGDDHTAATGLTVTETSFNTDLIPDSNIQFGGSGSNLTVTITPAAGKIGVAPITITVNDNDPANAKTTSMSFTVMVRPDTNTIFNDGFSYPDGAIITTSFGLWQSHSGTAGQLAVTSGEAILDNTKSEDVNVPLLGQRFSTNSNVALYSSFKVRFTSLPTTSGGSYFAHFKDDNTGAATGFGARVWASTLNASNGLFRIGIGNGANATNTSGQFPLDLSIGTSYTVVTKFVPTNGVATIWINPTSEASANVTATDVGSGTRPNPIDVIAYAFRESGEEGTKAIDDLKVGLSFSAVTGIASAIPLNYQRVGTNVVFTWSDASFALQSAPEVTGAYTNIGGATSPFTNDTSSARQFFRLKK